MLYELRKYDLLPGKQPELLNRFATFTTLKWKEFGIQLTGFWTTEMGVSNQLVYILAWESFEERFTKFPAWQASPERAVKWEETERNGPLIRRVNNLMMEPTDFSPMDRGITYSEDAATRAPYMFELRQYDAMPNKRPDLIRRFGDFTLGCFEKHGFRQIGYWTPIMGGDNHQLIYMLAWKSYEERTACFASFREDKERQEVFEASEANGPLVEKVTNTIIRPTAFSPIR